MAATPRVAVGAVVRDAGRRLLVVRRSRPPGAGLWSVPGGRVRAGESLHEATRREVDEETGLEIEVGELAWWFEHLGDEHHYVVLDFHARPVGGRLRAGDDAEQARWVTRGQLEHLATTRGLLACLGRHGVELA